jgi:hypothetical protein
MKRVQSREELKQKILLSLGHPYINVNLTDDHLDLAIDNALRHFFKYSPYGAFENHYVYTMGAEDVTNGWIPIPRYIDAVVEVLGQGTTISDLSFMTAEYQMSRETFMAAQRFNNVSLVDYVTMKQRLYHTQQIISPAKSFVFVRYQRRLIPNWTMKEGQIVAMKVYENVDPEASDVGKDPATVIPSLDLWDDEVLKELAIADAKKTWGGILKKFGSVVLPGGVTLDGQKMYDEGDQEFNAITDKMLFQNPIDFFMG